jgi:hypothetical protein
MRCRVEWEVKEEVEVEVEVVVVAKCAIGILFAWT